MSHTPGPWALLCDEARGRPRCLVVDDLGNQIAEVNPHRNAWNEDAHLINAAPDLLAACKLQVANIERWLETGIPAGPEESKQIYEALKSAVEKAEGSK